MTVMQLWCDCDCDDLVTTLQRAVIATVMWLRQNLSITQWRPNFVIFCIYQIGFTFLVPAHPGCPGKEAVKWL